MRLDREEFIKELKELVEIESPSTDAFATGQVAAYLASKYEAIGWQIELINVGSQVGPCLKAVNHLEAKQYDVLLLGHLDTVFPVGILASNPFRIDDAGLVHGPGCADMKAGDLYMLQVARNLVQQKELNAKLAACMLYTPDEELNSAYSHIVTESIAQQSKRALVIESARPQGELVGRRKGVARYEIIFTGIAAHAGASPESGASAIDEFLRWGELLKAQRNSEAGLTVNIGRVEGGIGANTIADYCKCLVDIRYWDENAAREIDEVLRQRAQAPFDSRIKVNVQGGLLVPPFKESVAQCELRAQVEEIGRKLDIPITWVATGGVSDGCFASNLGVPTIDGMGPVGGKIHTLEEYGDSSTYETRFALLWEVVKSLA